MVESSGEKSSISSPKDSEKEVVSIVVNISELRTRSPFKDLFPIRPDVLKAIKEDMDDHEYDESKPIDVWEIDGEKVIIDGHTRYEAAKAAGLDEVHVFVHDFQDEEGALDYALKNQRLRRKLSDADIFNCLKTLTPRKKKPGPKDNSASDDAKPGKSSERLAADLGTCPRKVEKALAVIKSENREIQDAVLQGKMTINGAYNKIKEKEGENGNPSFNDDEVRKAKDILSCPDCTQQSWVQAFLKRAQRKPCTHGVSKVLDKKGGDAERNNGTQ